MSNLACLHCIPLIDCWYNINTTIQLISHAALFPQAIPRDSVRFHIAYSHATPVTHCPLHVTHRSLHVTPRPQSARMRWMMVGQPGLTGPGTPLSPPRAAARHMLLQPGCAHWVSSWTVCLCHHSSGMVNLVMCMWPRHGHVHVHVVVTWACAFGCDMRMW